MSRSNDLAGKSAIITGGAGGLGLAIAHRLILSGAKVTIIDINAERLQDATVQLKKVTADPKHINCIRADITVEAEVKQAIDDHVAVFDSLDILVNNAGIMDKFEPVGECETSMWTRVIAVNLNAPFLFTKYSIAKMLASTNTSGGAILNVGSVASIAGGRGGVAYTTTKHALIGLTKSTAVAYAKQGIRCNIILPGYMAHTNVGDAYADSQMNQEGYQRAMNAAALGMLPNDIHETAKLVQYLCSDAASVVNGAVVSADHAWSAH